MRKFIQIIGHLFVFAFFLTLALVPTTEAATYDLSITSTPLKVANPGEIVTHVFTVQNTGTDPDTYSLSLQLPEGWTSLPIPEQTSVPSGSSKPIFVNVNVPKDAKAKKYDIKLTVSSSGDPTLKATKSSQIQVQSVPGFELAWELGPRQIGPGMTVEAKLKIVNTGNLPDHYEFQADSPQGWTFSIKEESVQLMPGQSRILDVSFSVPVTAKSGERYNLEVVATSRQDKSLSRAISLSGILAPPPPEQVDGSLFPNWDVYTNLSASQTGEPSFYFSGSGTIPRLGDVSANLGFSLEGVRSANLRVMKDDWGFILGNSSISGSYEGISGFPLFISETGNVNTRVIFTEESKGLSVEWDRENCNLRGVLGSDTAAQDLVFHELQGVIDFSEDVVLEGLITTATTQTESGTIIEVGLDLSGEKIDIYPSFVKILEEYPGMEPRLNAGVDVNYEEEEFDTSVNWDYSKTRLGEGPDYYHTYENNLNASTTLDLGEDVSSSFSTSFTWRKSDDDPVSNDLYASAFSGSFSGGEDLTWSLGASYSRTEDFVSDTVVQVRSFNGNIGFMIGESDHSLSLSLSETESPTGSTLSNTFTLTSRFASYPLLPRISLSRGRNDTTLYLNLSEENDEGLLINISFSASLVQQDSVSLSLSASYPGIFPFCGKTKGRVKGHIFVDEDRDRELDSEEERIQGSIVTLGEEKAITGEKGNFVFPPLEPDRYEFDLKETTEGLKSAVKLPMVVEVTAGETKEISVPLNPSSWIRGLVYDDKNQNEVRDSGEPGMGDIIFSIDGEEITKSARSGATGRFSVDLTPGTYTVKLVESSLPERYKLTTASEVEVKTEKFGRTEVSFGIYQKPKPVEITFGPPTAKFTYSPKEVEAGQEIVLDGSESSAIETEIETYEWELTHADREITRGGKTVRVKLEEPGEWKVTLIVTDKNGLKGKEIKTISVSR